MPSQATKILKLFIILLIPILIVITTVQLLATDQYLGRVSVDYEGNYFAHSESKTASLILKNLLVKANIIDVRKGREIEKDLLM